MNFFKHFTDAHDGRSMTSIMEKFGVEGYGAYFILMEICAKKLEKQNGREPVADDCRFIFHERKVREKLRMRSTKVELFLNYCSTLDLLLFTKVGDEFHFYVPKLLESMDRDSKRARRTRGPSAPKIEDRDIDKDREVESASAPATSADNSSGQFQIILPELAGNSKREQVLSQIPIEVQREWADRYDTLWLKNSILVAIDHYSKDGSIDQVFDWQKKLFRWFLIEKKPKLKAKLAPVPIREPVKDWPTGKLEALSDEKVAAQMKKLKSL